MKKCTPFLAGALLLALAASGFAKEESHDPAGVVRQFYSATLHRKLGFDKAGVEARRGWLTDQLYGLLMKQLRKPVPEGDAPDIDWDVFLGAQDVPSRFQVGKMSGKGDTAQVDVEFLFDGNAKQRITVFLERSGEAWRISDIREPRVASLVKRLRQ